MTSVQRLRLIAVTFGLAALQAFFIYLIIWVKADRIVPLSELTIQDDGFIFLPLLITVGVEIYSLTKIKIYNLKKNIFAAILRFAKFFLLFMAGAALVALFEAILPTSSPLYAWSYNTLEDYLYSFMAEVLYVGLVLLPLYIYLNPVKTLPTIKQ